MQRSLHRCAATPHATVIGAGLVGLTSAEALVRRGFRVTILERQEGVARECSFGNACVLHRSYSRPKTATISQLLRWTISRSQPVHVSWRALFDPSMVSFGIRFFLAGPQSASRIYATTQITDALAALSQRQYNEITRHNGLNIASVDQGLLMFFRDASKLQAMVDESREVFSAEQQADLFRVVSGEECVKLEPALAPCANEIAGGVYWMQDRTVCPLTFSQSLAGSLSGNGSELRLGETVENIEVGEGQQTVIRTNKGKLLTDAVVVAAGAHSGRLLSRTNIPDLPPLPLYGMRGHSLTLDTSHLASNSPLSRSLCDGDQMTFFSPVPGEKPRMRITGFGDFDGWGYGPHAIRNWRMGQLQRAAERTFPNAFSSAASSRIKSAAPQEGSWTELCPKSDEATRWCGLRPVSPDGLPLVGAVSSVAPVFVNAGHGMLGWTLSPGSAELLGEAVTASLHGRNVQDASLLQHLDPTRFRWNQVFRNAKHIWFGAKDGFPLVPDSS